MRWSISDTAEFGDYMSGPRVIDSHVRERDAGDPRRHPRGRVRKLWIAEMDSGEAGLQRSPSGSREPADRAGRRGAPRAHARARTRVPSVDVPVALLGYGTVGAAVHRLLEEQADEIERATGHRLRVVRALVRDPAQGARLRAARRASLTTDFADDLATTRRSRSSPR